MIVGIDADEHGILFSDWHVSSGNDIRSGQRDQSNDTSKH
jgi:hypothetical protein